MKTIVIFVLFLSLTSGLRDNVLPGSRIKRGIPPLKAPLLKMATCDPSTIPVMENFTMSEFSGGWYELGKTLSNYIDVNDGMWKITEFKPQNQEYKFLYSGRGSDEYCIRPISGTITASTETPGELTLKYRTFTTSVTEIIRVLYTDYDSVAVLYSCVYVNEHTGGCHPAGVLGSLWTRKPHVDGRVYEGALKYFARACINQRNIRIRNIVGPCQIDRLGTGDEHELAHDICYQSLNRGSCAANIQRFYFDKETKQCKEFTFGGCSGNKNNFKSLQECEHQCLREEKMFPECITMSKCALHCPPCCRQTEDGCVLCDCEEIIIDPDFECLDATQCPIDCQAEEIYPECFKCVCRVEGHEKDDGSSICLETKRPGNCKDKLEKYYYNAISSKCEKFNFTGCGGNNNNFNSLQECLMMCQGFQGERVTDVLTVGDNGNDEGGKPDVQAVTVFVSLIVSIFFFRNGE